MILLSLRHFDPLLLGVTSLYPSKSSVNLWFSDFSGGVKREDKGSNRSSDPSSPIQIKRENLLEIFLMIFFPMFPFYPLKHQKTFSEQRHDKKKEKVITKRREKKIRSTFFLPQRYIAESPLGFCQTSMMKFFLNNK